MAPERKCPSDAAKPKDAPNKIIQLEEHPKARCKRECMEQMEKAFQNILIILQSLEYNDRCANRCRHFVKCRQALLLRALKEI